MKATELSGHYLAADMSDTLVVAVSQSGTTTDTNRTVDLVRERGAFVTAAQAEPHVVMISIDGLRPEVYRQPALLGVSRFRFQIAASTLTASATLGGVASMKTFVTLFPPGLILSLVVLFAVLGQGISVLGLWLAAPWLVISPLMAVLIERRTTRAVDRLARSMAVAALPA